jgi:ABC-2 type transport system permease protein
MFTRKIRVVAATEFSRLIRTKAFLLSLVLVPLLSGGLGYLPVYLLGHPDLKPRRVAVFDATGVLFEPMAKAAALQSVLRIDPIQVSAAGLGPEDLRHRQLERIRQGELFAYLEIPGGTLNGSPGADQTLRYYSDTPTFAELPGWLRAALNTEIRRLRYKRLGVALAQMQRADAPVALRSFGADAAQAAAPPTGWDEAAKFLIPVGSMILLFMMVMLAAPEMMSTVIEEKMSRISEVLLSSVTPFELMLGKLLACCGASVLMGALYLALGLGLARHLGYGGVVGAGAIVTFFLFLVLTIFLHGSIFMAVGAACSQPKDAQMLLGPLVLVTAIPLLTLSSLMQDPSGRLATGLSYFPLSAPFVMCFRLNAHPLPPPGQVFLSVAVTLLATLFSVWAASRIFRVGLLAQGKAPGLFQLLRWVFVD